MRKVVIWRKIAHYEKWRILHIRYSLYSIDSYIRTGLFVYYFRKNVYDLKNEDRKLPKKPEIQSCITEFYKNDKKMNLKRLNVEKNIGYLFFRNPPLLLSTFS